MYLEWKSEMYPVKCIYLKKILLQQKDKIKPPVFKINMKNLDYKVIF